MLRSLTKFIHVYTTYKKYVFLMLVVHCSANIQIHHVRKKKVPLYFCL